MKTFQSINLLSVSILSWFLCLLTGSVLAQNIYDARQSVILQSSIQENPPAILLSWVLDTANGGYTIWRKDPMDITWGDSIAVLDPDNTSWIDTTVVAGIGYEYQVVKSLPAFPYGDGTANFGAGYVSTGIRLPPVHHRGACLVIIDSTFKESLADGINQLLADIEADGWQVQAQYVDRNDSVTLVKAYIKAWAESHQDIQRALFLFGRVPVPYSGEIAPDGHHSDHRGAWPCDGYYADLDGLWTDQTVNINAPVGSRNDNYPGDGKFDNISIPSNVELQVGRVDFANMDKFPETEEELLQRYLKKDHAWRTGQLPVTERGLIDNNFATSVEGLGQVGWKNFAAMFGIANVKDLPYRQTLTAQSYAWSYGCGGGGPESASDISSTTYFTADSLQTIFTMLFGSYFGDWDYPNDFLRGAIASRTCLVSTWGNRPDWILHPMSLGGHMGYSVQLTMNNRGLYKPRFYGGYVHTALMGDPTLRLHMQRTVENLSASQSGLNVLLNWQAPANADGFFIYKKTSTDTSYHLLNQVPVKGTTYIDACADEGLISYMVRSRELKSSGSGTYYNLSTGATVSIVSDPAPYDVDAEITMADPGQNNGVISIMPLGGCSPYTYSWDTGQTSSAIQGLAPGLYCVTISDCLGCTQIYCATIEMTSNVHGIPGCISSHLFPNPASDLVTLNLQFENDQDLSMEIIDIQGRRMLQRRCQGRDIHLVWDIESIPEGIYWLRVASGHGYLLLPFNREIK